jgi:hypothetical protein
LWEPKLKCPELNNERKVINNMRIQLIDELRKKYPEKFIGRISDSIFLENIVMT